MHTEYIWPRRKAYWHQVFFPLMQSAWQLSFYIFLNSCLPRQKYCSVIVLKYRSVLSSFFIIHIFILVARLTTIWHWALCEVWLQKTCLRTFCLFESFSRSRFFLFPSLHSWCHSGFEWPYFRSAVFCDGSVIRWEMLLGASGRLHLSPSEQTRVATHKSVSGSSRHFGSAARRVAVPL